MVNWKSLGTLSANYDSYSNLSLVMSGLYLWEWATSLSFDYRLLTNSKGSKWIISVYLSCRLSGLLMVIMGLLQFNNPTTFVDNTHLSGLFTATMAFTYMGMLLSSALIVLRTIAIWNHSQYIVWPITLALLGYFGVTVLAVTEDSTPMIESLGTVGSFAGFPNSLINRVNYTYGMIFDTGTLVVASAGALRYGRMTRGGLWMFIYHQGVIWILAVAIAYMFPVVFLWLNLNSPMNMVWSFFTIMIIFTQHTMQISMVPSALAMVIAATTMHRELYKRANSDSVVQVFKPTASGSFRLTVDYGQLLVEDVRIDRQDRDSMPSEMISMNSSPAGVSLPSTIKVDSPGLALDDSV